MGLPDAAGGDLGSSDVRQPAGVEGTGVLGEELLWAGAPAVLLSLELLLEVTQLTVQLSDAGL